MDVGSEVRRWEELIPDALELIFRNLALQELLTVVPAVCKSWGKVVSGPHFWQEIDIQEWSQDWCHRCEPGRVDQLVQMLVSRSHGSLRKLCVSGLSNDPIFSFIADHAASLQTLHIPGSDISDSIVEQVAERLSNITVLDVSFCLKIGASALEAIGRNCKSLAHLIRLIDPTDEWEKDGHDDEAHAIATTMPKLKRLDMGYCSFTTQGVLEIISNCKELEFLDIRGCWDVQLDYKFLKEKCSGLKVCGPHLECNDGSSSDGFSDYWDSSRYWAWKYGDDGAEDYDFDSFDGIWDFDEGLDALDLWYYEEMNDDLDQ